MNVRSPRQRDIHSRYTTLLGRGDTKAAKDNREEVLARRFNTHRIGFARKNLEHGFSANLTRLFPNLIAVDEPEIDGDAPVLMYGAIMDDLSKSHDSTKNLIRHLRPDDTVLFFEMGFLASTTSWSEALGSRNRDQACLGYIFDDRAQYYMSDYETRLDERLNGDFVLTETERARAVRLMERIVQTRISKYNSQPIFRPGIEPGYKRRVLVVDQNYSDASTFYGRASPREFSAMLDAAIDENPDALIIVKTHPDLNWVKSTQRRGYFDDMSSQGRIQILREGVNPFELFDMVDKVYVGTSGMGFEALMAGKEVVCFGAPWYAGWGLTDDRVTVPHRSRKRDLSELFHSFFIWYTIYHLPEGEVPAEIEDVLDFIEANRPVRNIPAAASTDPTVSIIIPVHGVERYVAECLGSIQRQHFQDFEVILIDDVSPDRSAEIIEGFCERDPRIRLVRRTENAGPGFVRNQGIEQARGRYVLFIDPDDYMPDPGHLERVVAMAEADGADMVRYRKVHEQVEDESGVVREMRPDRTEQFFPKEIRATSVAAYPEIAHSRHFWNWIYRRDFLNRHNIRFLTTYREERAFLLQAYMADPVISVCDSDGVVYRIRTDSAVRRAQTMSDVEDQLENFDQVIRQLAQSGALEVRSPHRWLAQFQVSQFLHFLYFGFAWQTAEAEGASKAFVEQLGATLDRAGLGPQDLIPDPFQLSNEHLRAGAYGLLLAATRSQRIDLVRIALKLAPIAAEDLYREYLTEPGNDKRRSLQQALNFYARKDRVTSPPDTKEVGGKPDGRIRLIIHLGATKTGSTVLQHLLEDNRPALLRKGIWYPEVGVYWQPDRPHKQAGHAGFINEVAEGETKLHRHVLHGLSLMKGKVHTVILSSEAFFLRSESVGLVRHFKGFDTEAVVYLRRQDEWANSQYAELAAGGAISSTNLCFSEWLETSETQGWLDYNSLIRTWENALPPKSFHVRRYDRARDRTWDIIEDFSETTGLPELAEFPAPSKDRVNESRLSAAHVSLVRQYNSRRYKNKNSYLAFVEEVTVRLNKWRQKNGLPMPAPWFLSEQTAEEIMATAAKGNDRIARQYFGCSGADLFPPLGDPPDDCPIHLAEFDIADDAYRNHRNQGAERQTFAEKYEIVNYGLFGWRRWILTPFVRPHVLKHGTRKDVDAFDRDPAGFMQALRNPDYKRWSDRLYPKRSVLGPGNVFALWIRPLSWFAVQLGGQKYANGLKNNPVLFFRLLRNPLYRAAGRIFFPIGEVVERKSK
ncbi:glycosyltransferase [Pseudoruegeria sp. HB172150]|uniref:glycosyltransferase n=1 Tax=Pseudoruegeria sp. HB172150 TaxID=2721164 RepID=UPI001555D077|nr:glycosyltransferase [Pseudoruegeria sp. HB172150]